jgi:hypothetical protein
MLFFFDFLNRVWWFGGLGAYKPILCIQERPFVMQDDYTIQIHVMQVLIHNIKWNRREKSP